MELNIGIGLLCTLIGMMIGLATFSRNRDKDVKSEASKSAIIETKLDNISRGVDSIIIDQKVNEQKHNALAERVVRVEESAKQAHKRLDHIDKGDV